MLRFIMSDFDLVVVGDCNADLIVSGGNVVPAFDQEELLVDKAQLTIGGGGGICASGAARLGLRVAMVGVVGDDMIGRFVRDELVRHGVDVSHIRIDPRTPTGLTIHLIRGEDRAMLTMPGTISHLQISDVDPAVVTAAKIVHFSSYFLQAGLIDGLDGLLRETRSAGVTTSIDPNWDPSGAWDGGLRDLLPYLDVLLPNETESRFLARSLGDMPEDGTVEDAARILAAFGPTVAVKAGSDGALAATRSGDVHRVPAARGLSREDSVGAGDSFNAGYLAGLLWGYDIDRALALAVACGGLSLRGTGGTGAQATRDEALPAADVILETARQNASDG